MKWPWGGTSRNDTKLNMRGFQTMNKWGSIWFYEIVWCCLAGSFWLNFSRSSSPACHPQYSKVFPYNVTARPGRSCRGPRGHRNTRLLGGFSNTWVFAGALVWAWHFCLWYVAIEYVGVNLRISNFLNQVMVLALLPWISFYINPYETSCHTLCAEWYAGYLQTGMDMREGGWSSERDQAFGRSPRKRIEQRHTIHIIAVTVCNSSMVGYDALFWGWQYATSVQWDQVCFSFHLGFEMMENQLGTIVSITFPANLAVNWGKYVIIFAFLFAKCPFQ